MTTNLDPAAVEDILRTCARTCVMPRWKNLKREDIYSKGGNPNNLVTVADREAEDFLGNRLAALLPGSVVVGEEGVEAEESVMEFLDVPNMTAWVIDPIDGTGNFVRGRVAFCLMVALVSGGETSMAWIYDPCGDRMAFAAKGGGAFLNGRPLVLNGAPSSPVPGRITGFSRYRPEDGAGFRTFSLGCAGHEYLRLLQGAEAFSVYADIKPWDHLPGSLLLQEAKGCVRKWDRTPYGPQDRGCGLICAVTEDVWNSVRKAVPESVLRRPG